MNYRWKMGKMLFQNMTKLWLSIFKNKEDVSMYKETAQRSGHSFPEPLEGSPLDSSQNSPAEGTRAETPQNHSKDTSGENGSSCGSQLLEQDI